MIDQNKIQNMNIVAAAGSVELADLSDEDAVDAAARIIDYAPEHLQDDFRLCCAFHIYRSQLITAVKNEDIGQMYAAQSAILGMLL